MTKKELVDRLAESFDLTKKAAEGVIIAVIEGIHEGTARDGISRDYARLRISAQPSDGFYREHCSHILENTCAGPAQFRDQARIFFRKMLREIEHI